MANTIIDNMMHHYNEFTKSERKIIDYIPSTLADYEKCKPVYINMKSWKEDITKVTCFDELPANAKAYLLKIEELTGKKIAIFSVGPDRTQTIVMKDLFKD